MKKIVAILKGKFEDKKVENKVKRVELALNSAELNFKSQKDDNEIKMTEIIETLNDSDAEVEEVITQLSEAMDAIEVAKEGLIRVQAIRDYLFEEVKE